MKLFNFYDIKTITQVSELPASSRMWRGNNEIFTPTTSEYDAFSLFGCALFVPGCTYPILITGSHKSLDVSGGRG
jgi:hypothetical protein